MSSDLIDKSFRDAAIRLFHKDGEVEVDADARVSRYDDTNGAYVQAWVWVPADALR